jgi:hypothetical protein
VVSNYAHHQDIWIRKFAILVAHVDTKGSAKRVAQTGRSTDAGLAVHEEQLRISAIAFNETQDLSCHSGVEHCSSVCWVIMQIPELQVASCDDVRLAESRELALGIGNADNGEGVQPRKPLGSSARSREDQV